MAYIEYFKEGLELNVPYMNTNAVPSREPRWNSLSDLPYLLLSAEFAVTVLSHCLTHASRIVSERT